MTTPPLPLAPVICIDSPCGAGGSSTAKEVSSKLGLGLLLSGSLYRAVAYSADKEGCITDEKLCAQIASGLDIQFVRDHIYLGRELVTEKLVESRISKITSSIAQMPLVRQSLLEYQLACRKLPGLVAEGRDMAYIFDGGLILRIFLTAPLNARAMRRLRQMPSGTGSFRIIQEEIRVRDEVDMNRQHNPLRKHPDAIEIDNEYLSLIEVRDLIIRHALDRQVIATT